MLSLYFYNNLTLLSALISKLHFLVFISLFAGLFVSVIIWYFTKFFNWTKLIKITDSFFFLKKLLLITLSLCTLILFITIIIFLNYLNLMVKLCIFNDFSNSIICFNAKNYVININLYFSIDLFGLILCFLAFFVALLSFLALDSRLYWKNTKFMIMCNLLSLFIFLFTSVNDIVLLFFFYECLLIPSFFFVYTVSPYKRAVQASLYFLIWTQIGSLLVLIAVSYIFLVTSQSSFFDIQLFIFTKIEIYCLYALLFFGFGFKVPMWPFHHWLTKTHVEAPAGFSMFLSGFLVKSALYGFFKLSNLLGGELHTFFFSIFLIIGVVDASLKMWGQTDLKKLVAYSTIQEMNLIYLAFCWGDSNALFGAIIFCITHSFLSPLLFYTVDCIQRRYHSRSIIELAGILNTTPNLGVIIFLNIIFYSGLPGTLKFLSEIYIYNGLLETAPISLLLILLSSNFLGLLGFCKCWFNVLFGMTVKKKKILAIDLTSKDTLIILTCYVSLFIIIFFINTLFI